MPVFPRRLPNNPIIDPATPGYDPDLVGGNINGPSLIRVPDWLPNPLGRYYLYFAHHGGHRIRLAYADHLAGPWRIHTPGTLRLEQTRFVGHIASPDVHVDEANRRIVMYHHGPTHPDEKPLHEDRLRREGCPWGAVQTTRAAISQDGLNFESLPQIICPFYFRALRLEGMVYGMSMPGILYRSPNGLTDWEAGPRFFDDNFRHGALRLHRGALEVFFSRVGDCPERILLSRIDVDGGWHRWRANEPVDVIAPAFAWEGADQPALPSERGAIDAPVQQLRDPAVYEEDGQWWLLYSVAGESGIAIAELPEV